MRAAAPHRGIHALDIERAFDELSQALVRREVRRKSAQVSEKRIRDLVLDLVPMLWALFQGIGQITLDFHGVTTRWSAGGIGHAGRYNLKSWRVVEVNLSASIFVAEEEVAVKFRRNGRFAGRNGSARGKRISGWFRGCIVKTDHRVFGLKQFNPFEEI